MIEVFSFELLKLWNSVHMALTNILTGTLSMAIVSLPAVWTWTRGNVKKRTLVLVMASLLLLVIAVFVNHPPPIGFHSIVSRAFLARAIHLHMSYYSLQHLNGTCLFCNCRFPYPRPHQRILKSVVWHETHLHFAAFVIFEAGLLTKSLLFLYYFD